MIRLSTLLGNLASSDCWGAASWHPLASLESCSGGKKRRRRCDLAIRSYLRAVALEITRDRYLMTVSGESCGRCIQTLHQGGIGQGLLVSGIPPCAPLPRIGLLGVRSSVWACAIMVAKVTGVTSNFQSGPTMARP